MRRTHLRPLLVQVIVEKRVRTFTIDPLANSDNVFHDEVDNGPPFVTLTLQEVRVLSGP